MRTSESPTTLTDAFRRFFDFLSPRVVAGACAIAVAVRLALGDWTVWDAAIVLGLVALWPLQEWLIHVFILHYRPVTVRGRTLDFAVPRSHRRHHRDPWNIDILFIPSHVFLYAIPLQLALWIGLAPTLPLAFTGLAAFHVLTLHYEWVHYLVHTRYRPKSWLYDRLWRNHRLHHCKNERYWFGVTMLSGDRLMRTAPALDDVPTSSTCRTLGLEDGLDVGARAA
ncbi:MAG: sterol desaturase family protein [Deltaproteobacteria bacterium]|nr:sterol desaturase family protein [Deltaproteobacteria bacterium]